jgi:phosphatidylserine/phosphatidylglycerophosphate/cardiolipin synthase-like enzyme
MGSRAIKRSKDSSRPRSTRLIVQPGDGIAPLLEGIAEARSSVDILIFRFDRKEIEQALVEAVRRGVAVRALIAWTNRGGERHLRELEARLLAAGILVARTADDLVRYHGKMMIVDRRVLYVLAFNFTRLDIDRSRSFGLITTKQSLVREAMRLFEADSTRQAYTPQAPYFLVSPFNSRAELAKFIQSAKSSLMIYDPGLRDREMVRLLDNRLEAGVEIRILGKFRRGTVDIPTHQLTQPRLHARVIVCDGKRVFVGSQSLRAIELDGRREIGLIVNDPALCSQIAKVFEKDWKAMASMPAAAVNEVPGEKLARKVAKAVSRELPPVSELVESVAVELTGRKVDLAVDGDQLEETVRDAVKAAVKDVLEEVALNAPVLNVA